MGKIIIERSASDVLNKNRPHFNESQGICISFGHQLRLKSFIHLKRHATKDRDMTELQQVRSDPDCPMNT